MKPEFSTWTEAEATRLRDLGWNVKAGDDVTGTVYPIATPCTLCTCEHDR